MRPLPQHITSLRSLVLVTALSCGLAGPAVAQQSGGAKVTVALIGEDRVQNSRPYMRSAMAAAFEDAMVGTKRFRVVSPSLVGESRKATTEAGSAEIDPETAIELGKRAQAKYVVIVRQITMIVQPSGFWGRPTLDLGLQAQVVNMQTTDIAESLSYRRSITLSNMPWNPEKGEPLPEDKLTRSYSDAVTEIATEFVTTAAVSLMPLETIILTAEGSEVLLDGGSDIGVGVGAEFEVVVEGTPIPRPGRAPFVPKAKAARLKVARVETEAAYAQIVETYGAGGVKDTVADPSRIKPGAIARLIPTLAPVDPKKKPK